MKRSTSTVLICLGAFLVISPWVLQKPGWPIDLKADEPAYYLMAMSLALDGDLRCELHDLRRIFDEFPYLETHNLILATNDGWHTVFFGKPYVYSLFAAPAAGLFGASGMVAFNALMMMMMVWLGVRYLRRYNPDSTAALFAAGFFLLSVGFSYVFWIQPEIFNMLAVTLCLYLGLTEPSRRRPGWSGWRRLLASPTLRAAGSGAALVLAAYNKPMLALLGLPVLYRMARGSHWRRAGSWIAGSAACLLVTVALSIVWIGHPSAYLGVTRGGQKVCSPHEMPIQPKTAAVETAAPGDVTAEAPVLAEGVTLAAHGPPAGSWYWMFRIPRMNPREVSENLAYFLWGRHTGFFPHFPFGLLALILFAIHGRRDGARRDGTRWVLLGSAAAVALTFLLWIPHNWQGGGGFVGNRYYVNAYPAFLFLVTRIPSGFNLLGFALGGLLLGPTLMTPMGAFVPWPTFQAHVRNFPYPHLPLELSLREVPGYDKRSVSGVQFLGRRDVWLPRGGGAFWTHGATTTEVWLQSTEPLERLHFRVRSAAAPNEVRLRIGDTEERLTFVPGEEDRFRRVTLDVTPTKIRSVKGTRVYAYRLEARAATGEVRQWTRRFPVTDCDTFAYNATREESFYQGAEIVFLGTEEKLQRDVFAVEWGAVEVPRRVAAGEIFEVAARARNASGAVWPSDPPTRVGAAVRWKRAGEAGPPSPRAYAETDVAPGEQLTATLEVTAPLAPGSYVLVLDLVYELVAWFSDREGVEALRVPVEVVAAEETD